MTKDAADRYPSAKELVADLKRFETGQLVGAHHYSSWQRMRRWVRRRRAPVAIAAVAIAVLGVGAAVSIRRINDEAETALLRLANGE